MKRQIFAMSTFAWLLAPPVLAQNYDPTDWAGYYLGVNSGNRWQDTKFDYAAFDALVHHSAVIGGAQLGYNFQAAGRQWVIGIEADADLSNQSTEYIPGPTPPPAAVLRCVVPPNQQCFIVAQRFQQARSSNKGGDFSARLRAGYAWERVLLYATGGASMTNARVTASDSFTVSQTPLGTQQVTIITADSATGTERKTLFGWTIGLGSEISIDRNISVAAEYRRSDYGRHSYTFNPVYSGNGAQSLGVPAPTTLSVADNRITLRLNYRFH